MATGVTLVCDWLELGQHVAMKVNKYTFTCYLIIFHFQMAYSEPVKTKVRVHNRMYEMTIPKYQFEDVNVRGLGSSVIQALNPEDACSTVLGNYKYPVEIIYAEPLGLHNKETTNDEVQAQVMDIEVCIFT